MFLQDNELNTYFAKAANLPPEDRTQFLNQANAYAFGAIGGNPPEIPGDTNRAGLKTAVALAYQLFAKGDTGQVDATTGNITEAAPAGAFVRNKERDPWQIVDDILKPYALAYAAANVTKSDRGVKFL
jgi:hypothetical protein